MILTDKKVSPAGTLNREDIKKTIKNGLIFLGPTLLVLIPSIMDIIPKDAAYYALVMWGLKVLTELIQRLLAGK